MENKRSRGVTFWGWAYIVFGIIGLLEVIDPQPAIYIFGMSMFVVGVALCVINLICGVFILKLNETARKTAILLSIIGIILVPISLKLFFGHPTLHEGKAKYYAERKQWIAEHYKPEHQQKALADFEKTKAMSEKMIPIVFIVFGGVLPLLLEAIPIYFFTRPRVKAQFK